MSDIGPRSNRLYLDIDGDQSLMEFFTEDEKLRLEDGIKGPKPEDVTAKQLFRKKLRISDIGPSSNRLYLDIDGDQSLMEFFTEDEKLRLEDGIKVTGLDRVGDKRCYNLRLCSKPGLTMYAGIGEMSFRNNLIKDNIVEIWSSRKNSNLRMVLCFGRYFPRAVIKFFLD